MLYLLVVRVFGTAAEKWYYLLILGWGEWMSISHGVRVVNIQHVLCNKFCIVLHMCLFHTLEKCDNFTCSP